MAKKTYNHEEVEKEVQQKWEDGQIYTADLEDTTKDPYYLLFEFPYPSGDLHVGHWYAFAVTDIYARALRMQGKNVLFPVGFDAFGLPAENAAIKNGADPKEWTYKNIEKMRAQMKSMGTSVDWSKEVVSCDPEYYKWTQWLFAKLYEHNLVEHKEASVKWCPKDQTVLANEQVIDGKCERCDSEVEEKKLTQWFMKITDYADRLLTDLDPLPWREDIKEAQRAWIGKSEGAHLYFDIQGTTSKIKVFTTRPDTVFGATYVVLAPEHPLVSSLSPENSEEVQKYVDLTKKKTELERSENKEKTGVELKGVSAINPATKEEIPVYIADYVLASYGTGAVMAVPAHDERDFEFAKKLNLPIKTVVEPFFIGDTPDDTPREDKPTIERQAVTAIVKHHSKEEYLILDWKKVPWHTFITGGVEEGQTAEEAARAEIREETGYKNIKLVKTLWNGHSRFFHGPKDVNRLAHFSQFLFELENDEQDEVIEEEQAVHSVRWVPKHEVMNTLTAAGMKFLWKNLEEECAYGGDGILANSGEFNGQLASEAKWNIVEAVGGDRTTNYRIRDWLVSRQRYWGCPIPVVYDPEGTAHIIPAEHLPWLLPTDVDFKPNGRAPLASSKELHERVEKIFGPGWTPEYDTLDTFVDSSWYYLRYLDSKNEHNFSDQSLMKKWLPVNRYSGGSEHTTMHLLYARFFHKALFDLSLVPTSEPFFERFNRGLVLGPDGQKMSKRWGNVVNPDELVTKYGADAVRIYLAFIGPYNEAGQYPWSTDGVEAMRRFLDRIYALKEKTTSQEADVRLKRLLAKTIQKVTNDSDKFKFNTALSALMVLCNELEALESVPEEAYVVMLKLIAPFAPHVAEHLWNKPESVHISSWPLFESELLEGEEVPVIVQVNGKKRGEVMTSKTSAEDEIKDAALQIQTVMAALEGKEVVKVIYVPGRILNLVTK